MTPAATQVSTSELVEGVLFYPIALVISATVCPGLTLCIPGLIFVTVLILIPVVAVAIVALLAAAVVAAPFLLVHGVRGLRERWTASPRKLAARLWRPQRVTAPARTAGSDR